MKIFNSYTTLTPTSVVTSNVLGQILDTHTAGSVSLACAITVDTNAAGNFVGATSNHVTITGHGYKTGLKGQVSNTGGALPTGLSTSTNYFIIVVDANTVSFATSYANAIAGTVITISGGSGTNTFTPTALAGGTVQAQWSNDQVVWIPIGSPTTVSAALNFGLTVDRPSYPYLSLVFAVTAGSLSTSSTAVINKDS